MVKSLSALVRGRFQFTPHGSSRDIAELFDIPSVMKVSAPCVWEPLKGNVVDAPTFRVVPSPTLAL